MRLPAVFQKSKKAIFIAMAILLAGLIVAALFSIYRASPESRPFADNAIFTPKSWELSSTELSSTELSSTELSPGQTETRETISLPARVDAQYWETVTIKTALPENLPDRAMLFFKSNYGAVSVAVDGREIYSTDGDYENDENGGRYAGRVWHYVNLPSGSAGKTLSVTQRQLLRNSPYIALLDIKIASSEAAVFEYTNRNHLFFFYGSTVLGLVSLALLFIAVYDIRKNPKAKALLYLAVTYIMMCIWSISESPVTFLYFPALFFYKPYILNYVSFLAGLLFTVPLLLYGGEHYGGRKLLGGLAAVTAMTAIVVCLLDLLGVYTIIESFNVILAVRTINILAFFAVAVINSLPGNRKRSRLCIASEITMCLLALVEIVRYAVFKQESLYTLIYIGVNFLLLAHAYEAISQYFNEREEYRLEQLRGDEILRRVEIQQSHYKQLAAQIELNRRIDHDLKQFRTILYGAARTNDPEKTKALLAQFDGTYKDLQVQTYCNNMEIDAIISYAAENCRKRGIEFIHSVRLPDTLAIPAHDLCVIIGNLLDNAVEAAAKCEGGRGTVEIAATVHNSNFALKVENTCKEALIKSASGGFKSTKQNPERHGLGLSIVKKLAETTGGELSVKADEGRFTATVVWEV